MSINDKVCQKIGTFDGLKISKKRIMLKFNQRHKGSQIIAKR